MERDTASGSARGQSGTLSVYGEIIIIYYFIPFFNTSLAFVLHFEV